MAKKEFNLKTIAEKYSAEKEVEMVSTGSIAVDGVLGGGIAYGAMYGFWGPSASGKSTIATQALRRFLKKGDKGVFIDVEKAFNEHQQRDFGVRQYVESGQLLYLTADNYQELDEICMAIAKDEDSDIKIVVVDSETALLVAGLDDVDVTSERPGQKARQSSTLLQKVKSAFYKKGIASIWVFHARANISMGPANPYAPQEKMAGGFAQRHVPDALLKVTAGQKIGEKETPDGQVIHLITEKCKYCKPFQKVDTELYFGKGINQRKEIIFFATQQGVIQQKGSFFTLPNGDTVRGREALYDLSDDQLREIKESLSPIVEND